MNNTKNQQLFYLKSTVKHNDNVICSADCEVVL